MRKNTVFVILVIAVMLVVTTLSYTYYINIKNYNLDLNTDIYTVSTKLSFNGIIYDEQSIYYDQEKKAYMINLYDDQAINYIGNLSVDLTFEVPIASKMRFQLKQSYELTRYYHNPDQTVIKEIIYQSSIDTTYHPHSLLKVGTFNQILNHSDFYTYAYDSFMPNQAYELNIISGGTSYPVKDNTLYYETCLLYLDYSFEFIQANRFSQVWNVDPLLLG